MISQRAANYAKVLYSLNISEESIVHTKELLTKQTELLDTLENPVIKDKEKNSVIDQLFHKEIAVFLKVLCENKAIGIFHDIFEAYEEIVLDSKNMLKAKLAYAEKPDDAAIEQIKRMLCDKYKKTDVILEQEQDATLIGGYVLYVGDMEYNKSIKGTLSEMQKSLIGR